MLSNNQMKKQLPYSTPEGYFDNLRTRLSEIPADQQSPKTVRPSAFKTVAPWAIALAACAVAAVVLLSRPGSQQTSDDDIIEYLIDSGTTLAHLEDYSQFIDL